MESLAQWKQLLSSFWGHSVKNFCSWSLCTAIAFLKEWYYKWLSKQGLRSVTSYLASLRSSARVSPCIFLPEDFPRARRESWNSENAYNYWDCFLVLPTLFLPLSPVRIVAFWCEYKAPLRWIESVFIINSSLIARQHWAMWICHFCLVQLSISPPTVTI